MILADLARPDDCGSQLDPTELSRRLSRLEDKRLEFRFTVAPSFGEDENERLRELSDEEVVQRLNQRERPEEDGYRDFSYYEEEIVGEYQKMPLVSREYSDFVR